MCLGHSDLIVPKHEQNKEMESEIYKGRSGDITLQYDPSACATASNEGEGAWSFRLWRSSIILAEIIENLDKPSILLELGAGLGLPSIVAFKNDKSEDVVCTDLLHAMPLLYHNITSNISQKEETLSDDIQNKHNLYCPNNHILQAMQVNSDEYTCSVCYDEIIEGDLVYRCSTCNFDICTTSCIPHIYDNSIEELPFWYQIQLAFQSRFKGLAPKGDSDASYTPYIHSFTAVPTTTHNTDPVLNTPNTPTKLTLTECDWTNHNDIIRLTTLINLTTTTTSTCPTVTTSHARNLLILGADITYSEQSVTTLLIFLTQLTSRLMNNTLNIVYNIHIILIHQVRSAVTSRTLGQSLEKSGWKYTMKLIEVSTDTLLGPTTTDDEEEGEGGECSMISNGIYRIDIQYTPTSL